MSTWRNDLGDNGLYVSRGYALEVHFTLFEPCHGNEAVIMAADNGHQAFVALEAHGFAHGPLPAILLLHRFLALLNAA
jgi:hypothetical protein